MREEPRAPAEGYHLVARVLPKSYFLCIPPDAGTRVSVSGRDGVTTVWDMSDALATLVLAQVRPGRGVRVSSSSYRSAPSR